MMDWLIDKLRLDQISFLSLGQTIIQVVIIIIIVRIAAKFSVVLINKFFEKRISKNPEKFDTKKASTMSAISKSIIRYTLYFIGLTTILGVLNFPISSLLATAGIGGLAIGFGAQNLVRDVITGFFILFEDQYSVGDYITVGSYSGIVEEIGVRTTQIRGFSGDLHILPNGNIDNVTNHSRGNMRIMFDVGIAYEEDIDHAVEVAERYINGYSAREHSIIDKLKVLGVEELGGSAVSLRIWGTCKPMEQWRITRELKKGIKQVFDDAGIEIPYQKVVVMQQGGEG